MITCLVIYLVGCVVAYGYSFGVLSKVSTDEGDKVFCAQISILSWFTLCTIFTYNILNGIKHGFRLK